jgi:hypothetical protein
MKPYSVTIYFSGSKTYFVDADNPEDAEEFALDEFADDNSMDAEVTDTDLTEDDPDE